MTKVKGPLTSLSSYKPQQQTIITMNYLSQTNEFVSGMVSGQWSVFVVVNGQSYNEEKT